MYWVDLPELDLQKRQIFVSYKNEPYFFLGKLFQAFFCFQFRFHLGPIYIYVLRRFLTLARMRRTRSTYPVVFFFWERIYVDGRFVTLARIRRHQIYVSGRFSALARVGLGPWVRCCFRVFCFRVFWRQKTHRASVQHLRVAEIREPNSIDGS